MKNHYRIAVAVVALLALLQSNVSAQTISYQGLLENNNAPVNGPQSMKISIYTADSGGTPLYSETQTVNLTNGIFNIAIGSVTPLLPTLDFTKQYYLAVSVNGGAELSPRSEVSFAPYAFRALNADTASYSTNSAHATLASGVSGGVVTSVNGIYGALTLTGTNGITVATNPGNVTIGNSGVQSVNTAGGKVTLVGSGGTTVADTGTTITIHSQTFTGGTGIQAVQNSDSSITIVNGSGPIATITLAKQNATTGQVLEWNGSQWKPVTVSDSLFLDSIKDLQDCRDDGSSVYLGAGSGVNNSGKNMNVALGIGALHSDSTGYGNTAVGDSALHSNTAGFSNVAIGTNALAENNGKIIGILTPGHDNTACGYECMLDNNGGWNSAFGSGCLESNALGGWNAGFGWEALASNTSGGSNSAFGTAAMDANVAGSSNTAVGFGAMEFGDSGSSNVAVGVYALFGNNRSNIVAVGDSALYHSHATVSDSSTANTALGSKVLFENSDGAYNTGTGFQALYLNTSGYRNTAVGYLALNQNSSGNDNTAVGSSAGPSGSNLNNTTAVGSGAQSTVSNSIVLGNVAVTSLYCMGAYAATTANSANLVVASNGQIMRSTSSARYKTDIHDLDFNADAVYDLRPVSYISKIDGKEYFGLVAEDVAKVLPELAEYAKAKDVIPGSTSDELIPDAVKYPMLSVLLLEELKKEHAKVESQDSIIADMERRLEVVEAAQKSAR